MDRRLSWKRVWRYLFGAAVVVGMWWIAFHQHERIPILTHVNLGFHEFGHMMSWGFSDLATAMMGSIAQVAVPVALAVYFLLYREDWMAVGLCFAWAGTSATEVAIYVADAPFQELQLIGGQHDWAFILGPEGYDALERASALAGHIRDGGMIALIVGALFCLAGPLRARPRPQREPASWTSVATADSSPFAASATSGRAPRSASSPKWTPPS